MYLFAGLGNPEKKYDGTRHNIGFAIVGLLEQKLERSTGWQPGKGEYYYAKGLIGGEDIILIMPTTYMNLSGRAVRDALNFYKIPVSHLVVICDDIALPVGQLRLRLSGSAGGHNGLSSIIVTLGTDEFARLRFGIGSEFYQGQQSRFVLSKFKSNELDTVEPQIQKAVDGCIEIVQSGMKKAMNAVNVRVAEPIVTKPAPQEPPKKSFLKRLGLG